MKRQMNQLIVGYIPLRADETGKNLRDCGKTADSGMSTQKRPLKQLIVGPKPRMGC